MKKIICLVLIFTMMLTACSKWNIEIVDPTKPSESETEIPENSEPEEEKIPEELTAVQERADKYIFEYEFRESLWITELSERGISVSFENRKYTGDETWEAELVFKKGDAEISIPFTGIYNHSGRIYYGTVLFPNSETAVFCGNNQAVFFNTETLEAWDFEPEIPDYGKENLWVNGAGINEKNGEIILFVTPLDTFKTDDAETIFIAYNGNKFTEQGVTKLRGTSRDSEKKVPFFYRNSVYFEYEGKSFLHLGYEILNIDNGIVWEEGSDYISAENGEHRLEMVKVNPKEGEVTGSLYLALLYKNGEPINSMMFSEPDFCDPNYSETPEDVSIAVNGNIVTYRFDTFAMTLTLDFEKGNHSLEYSPDDMLVDMDQEPITSRDGKYSIYTFGHHGAGDISNHHISVRNNDTKKHRYFGRDGGMYGSFNGIGFLKDNDIYFYTAHKLEIYDPETLEVKFDIRKNFPLGYDEKTDSERGLFTFRRNPEDFSYIVVYYEYENGLEWTEVENDTINYEKGSCNYKIGFLDSEGNLLESYDSGVGIVSSSFGLEEANMFYSEDELKIFVSDRKDNPIFTITFDMNTKEFSVA